MPTAVPGNANPGRSNLVDCDEVPCRTPELEGLLTSFQFGLGCDLDSRTLRYLLFSHISHHDWVVFVTSGSTSPLKKNSIALELAPIAASLLLTKSDRLRGP